MPGQARDWNGSGNAVRWPGAMTFSYVEVCGVAHSAPALWTFSTACAVAPGFQGDGCRGAVCRARTRTLSLNWCFLYSSGCPAVLADQAMDDLSARDPGGHIDRLARFVQRRSLLP